MLKESKMPSQLLSKNTALEFFSSALAQENDLLIEKLWDAPKAFLIAEALSQNRSVLVLTGGTRRERLLEDLPYFGIKEPLILPTSDLVSEEGSESPDLIGKHYAILHTLLAKQKNHCLIAPLQTALMRISSKEALKTEAEEIKSGSLLPFEGFIKRLLDLGYKREAVVSDKGHFAVRSGIIDLYPLSEEDPVRLDFFGDELEEVRSFDPLTQKTICKKKGFLLTPAHTFKDSRSSSLLDYLPKNSIIIFDDLLSLEDKWVEIKERLSKERFFTLGEFLEGGKDFSHWFLPQEEIEKLSEVKKEKAKGRGALLGQELQTLSFSLFGRDFTAKKWHHPFIEIAEYFSPFDQTMSSSRKELLEGIKLVGSKVAIDFLIDDHAEQAHLEADIKDYGITLSEKTHFCSGYLSSGFVLSNEESAYALFPYTEFSKRYKIRREKWRGTYHLPATEFHALSPGDFVVHFNHGVGKYLGTVKEDIEYMRIAYANGGFVSVPLSESHLITRYIGAESESAPTLHTLGSKTWGKAKESAENSVMGYATELLELEAKREVAGGFVYKEDGALMKDFEESFPFILTEDQAKAIKACKEDMCSNRAMDRLICGDVGYGKTEVAMRAAFKAVVDGGKQVAVLVPTTVLARQHFESFCQRMEDFPVKIGILSRTSSKSEILLTLKNLEEGKIDILIGTHRLISEDVHFKNLGLVIIDEEQRFGVRAKEKLKALKAGVDTLVLSATPIPRTLYLSMVGARSLSLINTPPQDRLPIKTIIAKKDPMLIKNALLREFSRDGQAYFIHNRVESIGGVALELQELFPDIRIGVVHGQMDPEKVSDIFTLFKAGQLDLLLATSIIENGIDVPLANTILVDNSQQFGLGDLYQIRGRVGRWNRPAYAYFLTNYPEGTMPDETRKRLSALAESGGFGGGMRIAMRDLEIRGAGDILGTKQSGQIATIGFHLYCKLLKKTVSALKNRKTPLFFETRLESPFPAKIPESYIEENAIRMEIYHRMGSIESPEELEVIMEELKDRFGPYPKEVEWLYHLTRIRLFAKLLSIQHIRFDKRTFLVTKKRAGKMETRSFIYTQREPATIEMEFMGKLRGY